MIMSTGVPSTQDAAQAEEQRYEEDLARAVGHLDRDAAEALARLTDGWGSPITTGHPQHQTMTRLARDLVAAGFEIHDCLSCAHVGGVCLAPTADGVIATWTPHNALPLERYAEARDVGELMNYTLADVLCALGWQTQPYGQASAHVVTGRLGGTEPPRD